MIQIMHSHGVILQFLIYVGILIRFLDGLCAGLIKWHVDWWINARALRWLNLLMAEPWVHHLMVR